MNIVTKFLTHRFGQKISTGRNLHSARAMATSTYDYNLPARFLETGPAAGENILAWEGNSPKEADDIESFVTTNQLRHGDVINFGGDRFSNVYIVERNTESGSHSLLMNPDESGAGYLTIPRQILSHVTNFQSKFKDVFAACSLDSINVHPSPRDEYLVERFGSNVPDCDFDFVYVAGLLDVVAVKSKEQAKYKEIDVTTTSLEDLLDILEPPATDDLCRFEVRLNLEGDDLQRYKDAYSSSGSQYSWINKRPKLPKGYLVETGGTSLGGSHYRATWRVSGPQNSVDSAKEIIRTFFDGFNFELV